MAHRNINSDDETDKRLVLTGKALSVSLPCVMGILNVTPDSFSDGGRYHSVDKALHRIETMVNDGAAIIDVGGESTRPGSDPVTVDEEIGRVIPVLEQAVSAFPDTMFSVDTTKYQVARRAIECGVAMVNDVSGLRAEPRFAGLCAQNGVILVIMHSQGTPKTMQLQPEYRDVVNEVAGFLSEQAGFARDRGVRQIVVDPGIGFGKTLTHNLQILRNLTTFTSTGYPVLVGVSRKSMIGQILADEKGPRPVDNRLAGTLVLQYHALINGAAIIRAHDVRQAMDVLEIYHSVSSIS